MDKVLIIAEAGVNHNGSLELAKKMVDVACKAKVDAIKFQSFRAENLVTRNASKANYQKKKTNTNESSQYEMLKKLEINEKFHLEIMDYCQKSNIKFMSSPFDLDSIDLLEKLNQDIYKIPSSEITNYPYLKKIGKLNKHLIISTGMSYLSEIEEALSLLVSSGTPKEKISVLHCNTQYPTPFSDVNLRAMLTIRDQFGVNIGYSDHTLGPEVSFAAVALGARIIEKHFTLDRSMSGPDHCASADPEELSYLVDGIRKIEQSLGSSIKTPSPSELENISVARKSIVAKRNIDYGELFTEDNLIVKRPGTGLSPMSWAKIIGKKSCKSYSVDEIINEEI